jgi:hypothetical protein
MRQRWWNDRSWWSKFIRDVAAQAMGTGLGAALIYCLGIAAGILRGPTAREVYRVGLVFGGIVIVSILIVILMELSDRFIERLTNLGDKSAFYLWGKYLEYRSRKSGSSSPSRRRSRRRSP